MVFGAPRASWTFLSPEETKKEKTMQIFIQIRHVSIIFMSFSTFSPVLKVISNILWHFSTCVWRCFLLIIFFSSDGPVQACLGCRLMDLFSINYILFIILAYVLPHFPLIIFFSSEKNIIARNIILYNTVIKQRSWVASQN